MAHRIIEIGASMNSLRVVSFINDIEDINETQEFQIRDSKYLVDRETLDTSPSTNSDPLCSSSGNECGPAKLCNDTHDNIVTHNSSSTSASDFLTSDHRYLRIKFARTSDFYGRITIYNLGIFGYEKDPIK